MVCLRAQRRQPMEELALILWLSCIILALLNAGPIITATKLRSCQTYASKWRSSASVVREITTFVRTNTDQFEPQVYDRVEAASSAIQWWYSFCELMHFCLNVAVQHSRYWGALHA